eukprot:gene17776-biopygen26739
MEKARLYMLKNPEHAQWALLLDSLCVVDADSDDAVAKIEALQDPDVVDALSVCPIQKTSKGRHYVFIRPEWADAEGYWDGARQVKGFDADLKTRCSTGTRGVLAVCPSLNKTWVREPWAEGTKLVDIPRTLMEVVAKPRQKKTTPLKVVGKDDIDTESAPPKLFDEVAELVDILAASRASSYRTWMEVGWCLHNISPSHLPLWEIFSKKCPENYTNGRCGEVWGTMNSEDCAGFRLGSLHMWARHDSPVQYWDIISRHVIEDVRACNGSHNEIARVAKKIIGNRIVAASTNGKLWYIFDRRWVTDIAAIRVKHELSTVVREHFMIALHKERASQSAYDMQSNASTKNENADRLAHITARLQDANFKNNVMQEMLEYFYDPDFMKKIDADPNLIGFNNGDLKDMTGGESITYRLLNSSDIVRFRPQHKIHIMCNAPPMVDGSDTGVQRRIRKIDYISRFSIASLEEFEILILLSRQIRGQERIFVNRDSNMDVIEGLNAHVQFLSQEQERLMPEIAILSTSPDIEYEVKREQVLFLARDLRAASSEHALVFAALQATVRRQVG